MALFRVRDVKSFGSREQARHRRQRKGERADGGNPTDPKILTPSEVTTAEAEDNLPCYMAIVCCCEGRPEAPKKGRTKNSRAGPNEHITHITHFTHFTLTSHYEAM